MHRARARLQAIAAHAHRAYESRSLHYAADNGCYVGALPRWPLPALAYAVPGGLRATSAPYVVFKCVHKRADKRRRHAGAGAACWCLVLSSSHFTFKTEVRARAQAQDASCDLLEASLTLHGCASRRHSLAGYTHSLRGRPFPRSDQHSLRRGRPFPRSDQHSVDFGQVGQVLEELDPFLGGFALEVFPEGVALEHHILEIR